MSVSTRTVFERLGFEPDWSAITDRKPAYKFDFGNMTLGAAEVLGRSFRTVFIVGGVWNDGRTVAHIEFELPLTVDSFEQGVAWLAHGIGSDVRPAKHVEWLEQGRAWEDYLPWVREDNEYDARTRCHVSRDWFKLAAKALRESSETARPLDTATLSFDGKVFRITAESATVATPAEGIAWADSFVVSLAAFAHLPKRLMRNSIEISVWEGRVSIARVLLPLINQTPSPSDP